MKLFTKIKSFFKNLFTDEEISDVQDLNIEQNNDVIIEDNIIEENENSDIKENIKKLPIQKVDKFEHLEQLKNCIKIKEDVNKDKKPYEKPDLKIVKDSVLKNDIEIVDKIDDVSLIITHELNPKQVKEQDIKTDKTKKRKKPVKKVIKKETTLNIEAKEKSEKPIKKEQDTTTLKIEAKEKSEKPVEKVYKKSLNKKYDKIVIFLTPGHTDKTPGKHSPDGRLYEWKYNRMIVEKIENKLDELGIEHWNSHPEDSWVDKLHTTDNKDLQLRVYRINKKYEEVKKQGKTAIMLSVHVNAAGNGDWYKATGWSAWTTKGQNNSDKLADCLYEAAEELLKPLGKKIRYDMTDGDKDFESNFYVIKHVNCVACLTENFFMDNKNDVDWLLSLEGQENISLIHVEGIKKYIEKYIK